MRVYLFDRDLAFFLFPGRPTVETGSVSSEKRVLAVQKTSNPTTEYVELKNSYSDVVLLLKDKKTADVAICSLVDAAGYAVSAGMIAESKKANRWLSKAEAEDAMLALKLSLARGRWDWDSMKRQTGVYKLYEAVSRGRRDAVIEAWFDVVEDRPTGAAVACLLSFASRTLRGEQTQSVWMKQAMERARRMCDLSPEAVSPLLLHSEGVPLGPAGLAAALSIARCIES